jgi:hypothetical protein
MGYQSFPDPYASRNRNINEGFRVGLIGGIVSALMHLLLPLFSGGAVWGELLAWLIQWLLYLLVARSAAQRQYDKQQLQINPLDGVIGAGVGAALITSILTWLFILIRAVVIKATGDFVIVEPISLYCIVVLDVLVALGLGGVGGRSVANKYRL